MFILTADAFSRNQNPFDLWASESESIKKKTGIGINFSQTW